MKPIVTIITAAYNSEKYLSETIDSVLVQTFKDWEMIIIDDDSTDGTFRIISNYSKKDNRIKYFRLTENFGAGEARNIAIQHAKGKYIAFVDSDDVWLPQKLELQLDFMNENKAAISFTGYSIFDEQFLNLKAIIQVPLMLDLNKYLKTTIIALSSSIVNIEIIGTVRFNTMRSRQDGILWIELLRKGYIAWGLNKQLLKYRQRDNSISANKIKASINVWLIFRRFGKLNIFQSLYYFIFYVSNNLIRRYLK